MRLKDRPAIGFGQVFNFLLQSCVQMPCTNSPGVVGPISKITMPNTSTYYRTTTISIFYSPKETIDALWKHGHMPNDSLQPRLLII